MECGIDGTLGQDTRAGKAAIPPPDPASDGARARVPGLIDR